MSIQSAHRSNDENTRPHSGSASSREADLGSAPIGSLLFKLALPAIAAQIINVLYNMVDRMYIGHIPDIGPSALTGVGVTMPIIMCISAFAALAAMGGAPQASILMGKGDKDSAEKVLGNCTFMLTVISLVLTALFLGFGRPILLMFGASEKTILYAWNYMKIYVCGTFFVQMALGLNAFINAQGYAKTGMITVAIGALCNIILDPIFIFGLHLDVRGAALATILSQGISCIWILRFLTGTHSTLRIRLRNLRPQKKFILPCLALGLAPFIMQFTESALSISFNTSLLKYGGDTAVGAMTMGPAAGAILGAVFGLVSFKDALSGLGHDRRVLPDQSAEYLCAVRCHARAHGILRRSDLQGAALDRPQGGWSYFIGALSAPLLNTLFFMGYIVLVLYNTEFIQSKVADLGAVNSADVRGTARRRAGSDRSNRMLRGRRRLSLVRSRPSSVHAHRQKRPRQPKRKINNGIPGRSIQAAPGMCHLKGEKNGKTKLEAGQYAQSCPGGHGELRGQGGKAEYHHDRVGGHGVHQSADGVDLGPSVTVFLRYYRENR